MVRFTQRAEAGGEGLTIVQPGWVLGKKISIKLKETGPSNKVITLILC